MSASDSPELRTLKECTPQLETAMKRLDRGLVHFLNQKHFIKDDVADMVLNPRSMLTEADKAWELVRWTKNRVKEDPPSYHVLLERLKQSGNLYKPIVKILETEYAKQNPYPHTASMDCQAAIAYPHGSQHHSSNCERKHLGKLGIALLVSELATSVTKGVRNCE